MPQYRRDALHHTPPPVSLRHCQPQVGPDFADELRARTAEPWTSGPLAEQARTASQRDSWIPTHGEPHNDNQVTTHWQLSELREYADWFSAPHTGSDDDVIAREGLREELGF